MVGRALQRRQPGVRVGGHLLLERPRQAGLADPGLATQQHHLPQPLLRVRPAHAQEGQLRLPPDQRGQAGAARGRRLQAVARRALGQHAVQAHRRREPLQRPPAERFAGEVARHEPVRGGADQHATRRRQPLQARRDVGRFPQRERLLAQPAAHLAHHHQAGVDAHPHRQPGPRRQPPLQAPRQAAHRLRDPQPGADRPLGVVLVRRRIAEVHQQPVAQVLRHVAVEAHDHALGRLLIGPHHLPQVLRVQRRQQRRRVHEVTEQHGQVPALTGGGPADGCGRCPRDPGAVSRRRRPNTGAGQGRAGRGGVRGSLRKRRAALGAEPGTRRGRRPAARAAALERRAALDAEPGPGRVGPAAVRAPHAATPCASAFGAAPAARAPPAARASAPGR